MAIERAFCGALSGFVVGPPARLIAVSELVIAIYPAPASGANRLVQFGSDPRGFKPSKFAIYA